MSQAVIAGLLVCGAVALLRLRADQTTDRRLTSIASVSPQASVGAKQPRHMSQLRVAVCLLAAFGAWLVLGGWIGLGAAVAIVGTGPRLLTKLESRATRKRRAELESAAPLLADLFAACLAAGASPSAAASAAASALGGAAGRLLDDCVSQFALGADHEHVWAPLLREDATAPIARAILRSAQTGAPLTDVLLRVADDLRNAHRSTLEQAAKAVGVKAVGPLGLCFLPAFMLLGVVPLIASLITTGLG